MEALIFCSHIAQEHYWGLHNIVHFLPFLLQK